MLKFDALRTGCYDRTAGWSSLVARWAHNPKVGGSNPPPATKLFENPTEFGVAHNPARRDRLKYTPRNQTSQPIAGGSPFSVRFIRVLNHWTIVKSRCDYAP